MKCSIFRIPGLYALSALCAVGTLFAPYVCSSSQLESGDHAFEEIRPVPYAGDARDSNIGMGPFLLRGQSPFQLLRLSLIPAHAPTLAKGGWQLDTTATWTNRWAWKDRKYLVDGEILYMAFFVSYGVTDRVQVRIEIPFSIRGGGFMDGFIEKFHDTFGFDQVGRDEFSRDDYRIIFWRKDGSVFELENARPWVGIEDVVLSTRFLITRGTKWVPHTCFALHLKVPTGDEDDLRSSGSLDGGFSLMFSKRIWKLLGYFEVQYTRFGGNELAGIPLQENQAALLTAIEYPWTDRFSIVLQELMNTGAAKDFYQFSETTHEVTLGLKAEFLKNTFFEFGLIENILNFDNSPDFGLHFGLARKF